MAKHKATRHRTPLAWRRRRWSDQWYHYRKPSLKRRLQALQGLIMAFAQKYK